MSTTEESAFNKIIGSCFTPDEERALNLKLGFEFRPDVTVPFLPDRHDLLKYFDWFLREIGKATEPETRVELEYDFLEMLSTIAHVAPGTGTKIERISSFAIETDEEDGSDLLAWGITSGQASIVGSFDSFRIGEWFDVESGEQLEHEWLYKMPYGLMIALSGAKLYYEDGGIDELSGVTYVPLNHGIPELYKIVRHDESEGT